MLTTIILTHNEANNIEKAIKSVSFSDEVIVIDDFSTDDTVKLCKALKAKVYQRRLNNDFSSQRNYGLSKATGDWVLFIDADETVPEDLKTEILAVTKNSNKISGYYLKRNDVFMGKALKYGETSKVKLLRLAKKDVGKWQRPVHEIWKVDGQTTTLKNALIHSPHPNLKEFIDSINHYTTIEAQYRKNIDNKFSVIECLIFPLAKFVQNYVYNFGFLDKIPGLAMAFMMSLHSLVVRIKLYEKS